MPISPRTVERPIKDMAADVTEQQTVVLKGANVFSVAFNETIDINDNYNPRLAAVARYCSNGEVHKKLCCLKPMYGTAKGKDILDSFTKNFDEKGIDIQKIFSITTDCSPAFSFTRMSSCSVCMSFVRLGHHDG